MDANCKMNQNILYEIDIKTDPRIEEINSAK